MTKEGRYQSTHYIIKKTIIDPYPSEVGNSMGISSLIPYTLYLFFIC